MKILLAILLIGILLVSCKKDNSDPEPTVYQGCFVTSVTDSVSGRLEYTFEYDKYRRIIKQQRYSNGKKDLLSLFEYGPGQVVQSSFLSDGVPYKTAQKYLLNSQGFVSEYIEKEYSSYLSDNTTLSGSDTAIFSYNSEGQLSKSQLKSTLFFTTTSTTSYIRSGLRNYIYSDGNIIRQEYIWTYPEGADISTIEYIYNTSSPKVSFAPIEEDYIQTNLYGKSASGKMPSQWIKINKNDKGIVSSTSITTITTQIDDRGAPTKIRFSKLSSGSSFPSISVKIYTYDCQ